MTTALQNTAVSAPETAEAPVIYANADERTVTALATALHDRKCRSGKDCHIRTAHAMDCLGSQARTILTTLASLTFDEDPAA